MTKTELMQKVASGELVKLHTSLCRGYVSRKSEGVVYKYVGRFGKGYTLLSPNWKSTRYSYATYFVFAAK